VREKRDKNRSRKLELGAGGLDPMKAGAKQAVRDKRKKKK